MQPETRHPTQPETVIAKEHRNVLAVRLWQSAFAIKLVWSWNVLSLKKSAPFGADHVLYSKKAYSSFFSAISF